MSFNGPVYSWNVRSETCDPSSGSYVPDNLCLFVEVPHLTWTELGRTYSPVVSLRLIVVLNSYSAIHQALGRKGEDFNGKPAWYTFQKMGISDNGASQVISLQKIVDVMRINPIAGAGGMHTTSNDTTLFGYDIPKDTIVFLNIWAVLHDPEVYPEPDVFKPERFLDDSGHFKEEDTFIPGLACVCGRIAGQDGAVPVLHLPHAALHFQTARGRR
ncbi:uncharacterized protein [Branchiostoma lanceolatum]|uniref:uncharacterized protein n=1 Tax=Branchiostoma lanceolatum TaxID=7740 RepID=UPI0034563F92